MFDRRKKVSKDVLDELLEDVFANNWQDIKDLGDIEVPDMSEMLDNFEQDINRESKVIDYRVILGKKAKRKRLKSVVSKIGIAASIFIIAFGLSIYFDTSKGQAFRFDIIKTFTELKDGVYFVHQSNVDDKEEIEGSKTQCSSDDSSISKENMTLEQAKKEIPFKVLYPTYLPNGYKLKGISWRRFVDGINVVEQVYKNRDEYFTISQHSNATDVDSITNADSSRAGLESIKLRGTDVIIVSGQGQFSYAKWYEDGFKYEISVYSLEDEEIIKTIKGLK